MNFAVIGAGVAGLAAAARLRLSGHRVTVFERHAQMRTLGAGVLLFPSASEGLEKIGVLAQLTKLAGRPQRLTRLAPDGSVLAELDFARLAGGSSKPTLSILRRDLMTQLFEACQGIPIHWATEINRSRLNELQHEFDAVLGCDGRMQSICRQAVSTNHRPVYSGVVNVIGISRVASPLPSGALDYWQPDQRFGVVPVSESTCYWAAAWSEPDRARNDITLKTLNKRFAKWPVHKLIQHHEPGSVRPIFVHDLEPIPQWHKNNVLLLGDAAHAPLPTSGQGACLAIEDADQLGALLDTKQSWSKVVETFVANRRQRTDAVQHMGRERSRELFPCAQIIRL